MKNTSVITLSMAALSLVLLVPELAAAQSQHAIPSTNAGWKTADQAMQAARQETANYVPARGALDRTLDSKDTKPGAEFKITVPNTIHLKDGQDLPRGSVLIGKVASDDMQENGQSKLALCINQAETKDGKMIPIKATITGIYGPGAGAFVDHPVLPGHQVSNDWSHSVLGVDQLNALSGVDLHSKIESHNSGVLVSTKKDDFKLKAGAEFAMAIEARGTGQQSASAGNR
jgi:hypothetical protein